MGDISHREEENEIEQYEMQKIQLLLEERSLLQKQIEQLTEVEEEIDEEERDKLIDGLESQKGALDQKIFNLLERYSQFSNYFQEGYSTQFRQCFKYFEFQKLSLHTKLFDQESSPDYFYIILKGKVGLYSMQKLYNGQTGYIYQENNLVKLNDFSQLNQQLPLENTPNKKKRDSALLNVQKKKEQTASNINSNNCYYLVKILNQGNQLGEMSILTEQKRTTSAIACEDQTLVLRLKSERFLEILKIREEQKMFLKLGFMKESSSINFLSLNALKDIYVKSYTIRFKRDQFVCLQNQYPHAAYLIKSGEFSLWSQTNLNSNKAPPSNQPYQTTLPKYHIKQDIKMSLIGVKEIFGDIEILSQQNYAFSLKCESEGDILIIPRTVYEAKVKQNDLLIQVINDKSSQTNTKRLNLYKKFTQNLEVFRHFMYDADDTDEEDSGKIVYNKGYDVFKKSKQYKEFVKQEKSLNNPDSPSTRQSQRGKSIDIYQEEKKSTFAIKQKNGQKDMKELVFLDNANCYELNNQDKKNFYYTYKGQNSKNSNLNSINSYDVQSQQENQYKENVQNNSNHNDKVGIEQYKVFQTDCPLIQGESQLNSVKNTSRQERDSFNLSNNQSKSILDEASMRSVFYRNHPPRPMSKQSIEQTRSRRVGSFTVNDIQLNKELAELLNNSELIEPKSNQEVDCGVTKHPEHLDNQSYSPRHSIGVRQMQEELISQLSQRLGRDDLEDASLSPLPSARKTQKLTIKDQRKIIKQLKKQNQDLFQIKIDPKLKQKLIGYEKNQNFINDYREQNLQVKRNSLHSNQIISKLNYQPNQIQEFIKNQEQSQQQISLEEGQLIKLQKNTPQLDQVQSSRQGRNQSLPHSALSIQNQFVPYYRRQSLKGRPNSQSNPEQNDYNFLLARIEDNNDSMFTPSITPSNRGEILGVGGGVMTSKYKQNSPTYANNKKPQTAIPLPQRKNGRNQILQKNNNKSQVQKHRESNSSFGTSQTMNSELDGFDKSYQNSFEINGYDINQYRQDRIKSQSFSLNIMNSMEVGKQVSNTLGLNTSKMLSNRGEIPFISRRQTFNCITNQTQSNKNKEEDQTKNLKQLPPKGKPKLMPKPDLNDNNKSTIINSKNSNPTNNGNLSSRRKELIPETLFGNQIQLKKKEQKSTSQSSRKNNLQINQISDLSQINSKQVGNKTSQEIEYQLNNSISNNANNKKIDFNSHSIFNQNSIYDQKLSNSFVLGNQPIMNRVMYSKLKQKSRDCSQELEQQHSYQEGGGSLNLNDNIQRYISFDFRPPSFVKQS